MLAGAMSRHTTFKFCLDPTVEQHEVLARHAGAARFAFNLCLRMVETALTQRKTRPDMVVSWSGFDLINAFNGWKKTEDAGRVFTVDTTGVAATVVTGLPWRTEVCQQVFEEAAVDCGRALAAWSDSRSGKRKGKQVGFPRFKRKTERVFTCGCGHSADRDCNAAVNLARWGQTHHEHHLDPRTPKHGGRATNARRRDGADQHPTCAGETSPDETGTDVHSAPAA
jgi:putative transposase